LQSYATHGRFDPEDYARRIAAIFSEGRIVGRGRATEEAAERIASGVPWQEAGTPAPSAGNGSAMRAGPIGLIFFDDHDSLIRAARDQGSITHRDTRCSAGSVTIAGAVALALQDKIIDAPRLLSQLVEWVEPVEEWVAFGLQQLVEWILLSSDEAANYIAKFGQDQNHSDGWRGISPFVTGSVLWSLYSFLKTPEDYWETICTAIAVGGDVDTTAAMAGAISGTHLGLEAIPSRLAHRLTDRGTWGFAELVELAQTCYRMKTGWVRR
jgi:ADP-ribosylglycohydrolase